MISNRFFHILIQYFFQCYQIKQNAHISIVLTYKFLNPNWFTTKLLFFNFWPQSRHEIKLNMLKYITKNKIFFLSFDNYLKYTPVWTNKCLDSACEQYELCTAHYFLNSTDQYALCLFSTYFLVLLNVISLSG